MQSRKYDICFFEQYAQISLSALPGSDFDALVNLDRPDLQTPAPADSFRHVTGIPYISDGDISQVLDIYYASEEKRKNALLIDIHGGFYIAGRRESNRHFASVFLPEGFDDSGPLCLSTCTNDFLRGESLKLKADYEAPDRDLDFVDMASSDKKVGHVHNSYLYTYKR